MLARNDDAYMPGEVVEAPKNDRVWKGGGSTTVAVPVATHRSIVVSGRGSQVNLPCEGSRRLQPSFAGIDPTYRALFSRKFNRHREGTANALFSMDRLNRRFRRLLEGEIRYGGAGSFLRRM